MDNIIYMKWIGVLTVLGRLASAACISADDHDSIDRAFNDANILLMRREGSTVYFARDTDGGWSPFDKSQRVFVDAEEDNDQIAEFAVRLGMILGMATNKNIAGFLKDHGISVDEIETFKTSVIKLAEAFYRANGK